MKKEINPYFTLQSLRTASSTPLLSSNEENLADFNDTKTARHEIQIPYHKLLFTSVIPQNLICKSCNSLLKVQLFSIISNVAWPIFVHLLILIFALLMRLFTHLLTPFLHKEPNNGQVWIISLTFPLTFPLHFTDIFLLDVALKYTAAFDALTPNTQQWQWIDNHHRFLTTHLPPFTPTSTLISPTQLRLSVLPFVHLSNLRIKIRRRNANR